MTTSPVYRPHQESPATARLTPYEATGAFRGMTASRFEIVSRGDFVPGILFLPPELPPEHPPQHGEGVPLVLLQHGLGGSKESAYLECAARWVRDGFAVAAIDLPLHGERMSPKLSARLIEGIGRISQDEPLDAETNALVEEFARQSTSDLVRTLDAIASLDGIDESRIGIVGFSLGAIVGTYLLAHDPRPVVAVLALVGGGRGPAEFDPATYIGAEAGQDDRRPLLIVAAEDDERISVASSRTLFEAAHEPKEFHLAPGDHGNLTGKTLGKIQDFLKDAFAR